MESDDFPIMSMRRHLHSTDDHSYRKSYSNFLTLEVKMSAFLQISSTFHQNKDRGGFLPYGLTVNIGCLLPAPITYTISAP